MVEHAARRQRGGQQRTCCIRQLFDLGGGARAHGAAAGNDDRASGICQLVGQLLDLMQMRRRRLRIRHDVGRGPVFADLGQRLLLQVIGHAEHDRHALMAHGVERLADVLIHPLRAVRGDVACASGGGEWRLIDILIVPTGMDRRFAREHNHRDAPLTAPAKAVMIWVKPGPQVTDATPTLPVAIW